MNEDYFTIHIPKKLLVLQYHFIDYLGARLDPCEVFGNSPKTQNVITKVKEMFKENGWEGDGDIKLIWIPPFLDQAKDEYNGDFIWHVKQDNNGTSFLGFPETIQSARLLDQNNTFNYEGIVYTPIHLISEETKNILNSLEKNKELLTEIKQNSNNGYYSDNLYNLTLGCLQNNIVSELIDFIDYCYLNYLCHVLECNNPDSIKLSSMNVKLNLTQISETTSEIGETSYHWLTIRQIIGNIWKDFKFRQFKDKFKDIVNCVDFDCPQNIKEEIYKHVLIRNCIQHHQWQLDGDSLKNFGKNKITVLNDKGKRIEIREWKKIYLSINEIENLIENVNQFIKQYDGYIKTRIKTRDFLHNS